MAWHIKMGKLPWCKLPFAQRTDLALLALEEGIALRCSHLTQGTAQRMVAFLQQYGVEYVRVADGMCEAGDPTFPDMGN
jgi:hypothetical protein